MNKTELVDAIASKADITKVAAKTALEATLAAITESLKAGEPVQLVGFGTNNITAFFPIIIDRVASKAIHG